MRLIVRPVEPITRIVRVTIKWFWPEQLIAGVEKWNSLKLGNHLYTDWSENIAKSESYEDTVI